MSSVFSEAKWGINASDKRFKLIIAPLKDEITDFGAVVLRVQKISGEYRVRSVMFMTKFQTNMKFQKARELGEPILQF